MHWYVFSRMFSLFLTSTRQSLHAPTQELRQQIVPTSKAWPLDRIMSAVDQYLDDAAYMNGSKKQTKMMIEYVLIANVNDSLDTAHTLGRLMQGKAVVINVIPYNKTDVPHDYEAPPNDVREAFCSVVRSYGLLCLLRQTLGDDVDGACGQLVLNVEKKERDNKSNDTAPDIEDLVGRSKAAGVRRREVVEKPSKQTSIASSSSESTSSQELTKPSRISATSVSLLFVAIVVAFFLVRAGLQYVKTVV